MGRLTKTFLTANGYDHADVFIETGTHIGKSTARVAELYPVVYTIELHPQWHALAKERLQRFPHVKCLCGDSVTLLKDVIDPTRRTVFWLDAHCDGSTPEIPPDPGMILRELEVVLSLDWQAPFAALIDDAEKFGERFWRLEHSKCHKREYWSTVADVTAFIQRYGLDHKAIPTAVGEIWAVEKAW